jgi:hypothetical protein
VPSFESVLADIQSLVGLRLKSIKPGADITLTGVDTAERRFLLTTSNGVKKSRPFSEVENIIKALNAEGIVHVDTVLAGSGSSRNQPETILANLPYIDYTFIDKKKHLLIRDEPSHELGKLHELDLLEAKGIVDRFKSRQTSLPVQLIVTSNIREVTTALVVLGGDLKALGPTVYSITVQGRLLWVMSPSTLSCSAEGAYALLPGTPSSKARLVGTLFGNLLFEEPGAHLIISRAE